MSRKEGQMEADIHTLYESDFCRIPDFRCRCIECGRSKPEYSSSFAISFIRTGHFISARASAT